MKRSNDRTPGNSSRRYAENSGAALGERPKRFAADLSRRDSWFRNVPAPENAASAPTFRQRLDEIGECNSFRTPADEAIIHHLPKVTGRGDLEIISGKNIPPDTTCGFGV